MPAGETPQNLPGHTEWVKGAGPHPPETKAKLTAILKSLFAGVPKPPEQKQKMRMAKLGVPKTLEHRKHMSEAQKGKPKSEAQKASMRKAKRNGKS